MIKPIVLQHGESVTAPGFYLMPAHRYHADPVHDVSVSSGLLRCLLDYSPRHAAYAHPRLNPDRQDSDATRGMDFGSVTHKLVLQAGADIHVVEAENYRTKAAQEARDAARSSGLIPILAREYEEAERLAEPLRDALEHYLNWRVADCLREVVVCWREGEGMFWRRCMFDILTPDGLMACDLKSTKVSLHPTSLQRQVYGEGYDVQAAFYLRGLDDRLPETAGRRRFGFLFGEKEAPHAISSPIEISNAGMAIANSKVDIGLAKWDACLERGSWPDYSREVCVVEPPTWHGNAWESRLNSDESLNP